MKKQSDKQIARWLILGGILVLVMVMIGGITRLTHSGLSMVTWQPVRGVLPPMNEQEWQEAFNAYKQIPEYRRIHFYFTLQDFKKIFFWEYVHRMLGRLLGLVFFIPFIYFIVRGKIRSKKLFYRLLLIFFLGGLQGLAGWYMVKSGLVERTEVDHIRLALHMTLALLILTTISWTVFQLRYPRKTQTDYPSVNKAVKFFLVLTIIQIIYGGLTAGLKAGYVFPTYPKMGTHWFPPASVKMFNDEGLISLLDFPATVQFIHRWLGFVVMLMVLIFIFYESRKIKSALLRKVLIAAGGLVLLQYTLGILVILTKVHLHVAVTHQLTAFILYLILLFALFLSRKRTAIFEETK